MKKYATGTFALSLWTDSKFQDCRISQYFVKYVLMHSAFASALHCAKCAWLRHRGRSYKQKRPILDRALLCLLTSSEDDEVAQVILALRRILPHLELDGNTLFPKLLRRQMVFPADLVGQVDDGDSFFGPHVSSMSLGGRRRAKNSCACTGSRKSWLRSAAEPGAKAAAH